MGTVLDIVIGCLVAGWIAYPLAMSLVGSCRGARSHRAADSAAAVSVLIATRDPVELVQARIANLQALQGEVRLLEILVAVDHTARHRMEEYRAALGGQARLVAGDAPGGKAATLNAAVRAARGDILLFTDSAQQFLPGAIQALVESLQEPSVGASTGVLQIANHGRSVFLRAFWAYELWLRKAESRAASIVAVTGAIYALHRRLWEPLPAGLICDDLYVPLQVIRKGFKVVSCETAAAVDSRSFGARQELDRKVRTLTGMLQMCVLCPWVLNPWRNRAWLQFVFHKLLRIVTPALMAVAVLAGLARLSVPVRVEIIGIAAVSLAALWLLGRWITPAAKASRQLGWLLLFLCAPAIAVANAVRGKWDIWNSRSDHRPAGNTTGA